MLKMNACRSTCGSFEQSPFSKAERPCSSLGSICLNATSFWQCIQVKQFLQGSIMRPRGSTADCIQYNSFRLMPMSCHCVDISTPWDVLFSHLLSKCCLVSLTLAEMQHSRYVTCLLPSVEEPPRFCRREMHGSFLPCLRSLLPDEIIFSLKTNTYCGETKAFSVNIRSLSAFREVS